jgi:hypothetical protein
MINFKTQFRSGTKIREAYKANKDIEKAKKELDEAIMKSK